MWIGPLFLAAILWLFPTVMMLRFVRDLSMLDWAAALLVFAVAAAVLFNILRNIESSTAAFGLVTLAPVVWICPIAVALTTRALRRQAGNRQ